MSAFEALKIRDFDHIEFAVGNLEEAAKLYLKMGFVKVGERSLLERKLKSYLMVQGRVRVVLSQSEEANDPVAKYVAAHGPGICRVAFLCEDAFSTLELALSRGAEAVEEPRSFRKDFGKLQTSSIRAFGDVRHTFVSREGEYFGEGFESPLNGAPAGIGLKRIDHITNNVEKGALDEWAEYYEKIFGLQESRHFDIRTDRTGLLSKVMESPNGVIKMPINEPTEETSQIQEFLDIHHGPGVQHLALTSDDIVTTLETLRKKEIPFLEVPATYYEEVPKRVPHVKEDLTSLQRLGILVDGDDKGYLLQIFTQNLVGPFFYEIIQRRGNNGFGEGNFRALFEAIERDQIRRGVLKA